MITLPLFPQFEGATLSTGTRCYVLLSENDIIPHKDKLQAYLNRYGATVADASCLEIPENPGRFIVVGDDAASTVLGRKLTVANVERGFSYVMRGSVAYPVLWVPALPKASDSPFTVKAFYDQLHYAVSRQIQDLPRTNYHAVESLGDVATAYDNLVGSHKIAFDFETCGVMWSGNFKLLCLALTGDDGETYVIPEHLIKTLPIRDLLCEHKSGKIGHNVKYDALAAKCALGWDIYPLASDTRLKRKLAHDSVRASLEICSDLVGCGGYEQEFSQQITKAKQQITKARGKKKGSQLTLDGASDCSEPVPYQLEWAKKYPEQEPDKFAYGLVDKGCLYHYCAMDTYTTRKLEDFVDAELRADEGLSLIWNEVVGQALGVYVVAEAFGMPVDGGGLSEFTKFVDGKLEVVRQKLKETGVENPTSNKEVAEYLFSEKQLQPVKFSDKTGKPSTNSASLKALSGESEAAELLLEFRRLQKLSTSYGHSLVHHIGADGRVRASHDLAGARSGRTSCSEPNLQQVPSKGDIEAKMLKDCFVAPDGWLICEADFSQLEIRIAALLSQDKTMIEQLESGEDFHRQTAKLIAPTMWGITPEEVTDDHRKQAKTVVFGLIYGMTPGGLASRLNCEREEANRIRKAVLGEWRGLAKWLDKTTREAKETGYCRTWWMGKPARRRAVFDIARVFDIASEDRYLSGQAKRQAGNTPIQGTANDFCLKAAHRIKNAYACARMKARVVLTVHDSIISLFPEMPVNETERVKLMVRDAMTKWQGVNVPIEIEMKIGKRWGSLEKVK